MIDSLCSIRFVFDSLCVRFAYAIDIPGVNDAENFSSFIQSMASVGMREHVKTVVQVLSGILHLGNIRFAERDGFNVVTNETKESCEIVAKLFQISPKVLEGALCQQQFASGRGSVYNMQLSTDQCVANRDALAKATYESLFTWFISTVGILHVSFCVSHFF